MPIRTVLLAVVAVEVLSELLELPQATSRADAASARARETIVFMGLLYQPHCAIAAPRVTAPDCRRIAQNNTPTKELHPMETARYGTIVDRLIPHSQTRSNEILRDLALVVGGTALVAGLAQISIPWYPVPFTGQTLAVLLVGGVLGSKKGALALALYFIIGALGAPIFTDQSAGWDVITGATGGYIIGFIVAAAAVGWLAERGADRRVMSMIGALLLGNILIYAFGVPWLATWDPAGDGVAFGWAQAYKTGVQPFILGDLVKLAFAAALLPAGWALLQKSGVGSKNEEDGPKAGLL
jgi:biotin transport system substrate-specific component